MADFDIDVVRDFMISKGGKIQNNDLVSHFKTYLNDPRHKATNRAKFKSIVNTLAIVKLETTGEKVLVLKKKYRGDDASAVGTPKQDTPAKKLPAPKAKLKDTFVPRAPSETDEAEGAAAADDEEGEENSAANESGGDSLLSQIQKELQVAGLKEESSTDKDAAEARASGSVSPESEVFEDALSQQESPTHAPKDIQHEKEEKFQDTHESSPEPDKPVENTENDQTDAILLGPETQMGSATSTFESDAPPSEPFHTYQESKMADSEEPVRKEEVTPEPEVAEPEPMKHDAGEENQKHTSEEKAVPVTTSSNSSREGSVTSEILPTPVKAKGSENLGPKEEPMSVKDRTKHFNKISSQTDLQSIKKAPEKLLRRSELREGSEESDIISLNPAEREWMMEASKSDYHVLYKILLKHPHLAKRKDFTSTALHWACKHGKLEVVKLLCGTEGVHVNAKSGYTPLHLAAMAGHESIIELLVQVYGADTNIRDYNGKKAKQYLKNSASSRCQQLLQPRRGSMIQGSNSANFKRSGSYSSKIATAGHFGIKVASTVRNSLAMPGSLSAGSLSSRSRSPSPRTSPANSRKGSMRDDELMPPPQEVPMRRKRNKRNSSKDKIKEQHEIEKTESDPCLTNRAGSLTAIPAHASNQELNRADSDPAISLQQQQQGVQLHPSVSYSSVV